MIVRPLRVALPMLALVLSAVPVGPSGAAPGVYQYPGSAPCNGTLQECIYGVPVGATVQLKDTQPIVIDSLFLPESVTLEAAPGDDPILRGADAETLGALYVTDSDDPDSDTITIRNLTFEDAYLQVGFNEGASNRFTLTGSTIMHNLAHNNTNGLNFFADAPTTSMIRNNLIETTGAGIRYDASALSTATIENNRIFGADDVANVGAGILGGFNGGRLSIRNNVFHELNGCNCASGAIDVTVNSPGTLDVVGNTIDDVNEAAGIMVLNNVATGYIFNNTVTNAERGMDFDGSAVSHDHNNSFNNTDADNYGSSGGPGTELAEAPEFVAPGQRNFRLKSTSDLVNAGVVCNPGGGTNPDLDGNERVWKNVVDVGAYEFGAPNHGGGKYLTGTTDGEVLRGTNKRDVICGLDDFDDIDAKDGNDLIDPGIGPDRVSGGGGKDRILSRDDDEDTGSAGSGDDVCLVDSLDDFSSCVMKVAVP